jgi:hypothetical protein
MKKLLSSVFIILSWCAFSQKCSYQTLIHSEDLKETGKFKLIIKNTDHKTFKIPKKINFCNMRLESAEFYNKKNQSFEKINPANKDIDCFTYKDREIKLKPNKEHVYEVNMKSDFAVLQSDNFFEAFNDRKYRFKVSFALGSYSKCGKSNKIVTDWIYKN